GTMVLANATIKDNKVMAGLAALTKTSALNPLTLKELKIIYKIENGKLIVDPFDMNAGNIKMNIGGSNTMAGGLDYKIKMDIPAGATGTAVNNALSSLTGKPSTGSQNIKVTFKIGGTVTSPKIVPEGGGTVNGLVNDATNQLKDRAKQELDNTKADLEAKAKAQADSLKNLTEQKAKQELNKAKADAEDKAKAQADSIKKAAEKKAKDALKNKFKF
ncbi:MAG TPA: AsmA-like C-terminal region-containing protein, partial [Cytophagaceae bacterium]|nr:AsmA-like C-terminal region-containing protein [Cytophagaceae bacterium]